MRWPVPLQGGAGRADIAGEGEPLPHNRIDDDWQPQCRRDRARGLQGAGVGGHDDALDSLPQKLSCGCLGLRAAELGQMRIDDAGIAPCGAEMEVEFALAMAQQDHASGP